MQGAQKWADHGEDLTRESLPLHCLGDVKSETSKEGEREGATGGGGGDVSGSGSTYQPYRWVGDHSNVRGVQARI